MNKRSSQKKFVVINAGIPGTNSAAIVSQLEMNLRRYKPHMVLTMFGVNDSGDTIPYEPVLTNKAILFMQDLRSYKLLRLLSERMAILKNTISKTVGDDLAYLQLGRLKKEHGDFEDAEQAIERALELNPTSDEAYLLLGRLKMRRRDFRAAGEAIQKAIGINPRNDEAYILLGRLNMRRGQFGSVESAFRTAIEMNPSSEKAYTMLGWLFMIRGDFQDAEKVIEKAIEINPRNDEAHAMLVRLNVRRGLLSAGEKATEKAIEMEPTESLSFFYGMLARLYRRRGAVKEADEISLKLRKYESKNFLPALRHNYRKVTQTILGQGIEMVAVQYPVRSVRSLKKYLEGINGIVFVSNEESFKKALSQAPYDKYFYDSFGGNFGHCTPEGNKLIAQNLAGVILKRL